MAEVVGGDLYHLWRVSEVHLPRIADVYYDAGRAVGGAASNDSGAFRDSTPAYPGATAMTSPVGAAWAQLRDELAQMYGQIGGTILTAAEGIRQARQGYIDSDQAIADEFRTFMADENNHNPNDVASNPPAEGADDDPGAPYVP